VPASDGPTIEVLGTGTARAVASERSAARFVPGSLVAGRYRIVALLGQGGMGEVYRADDLALGQAVALKFLPRELSSDPQRLARLRSEVSIARQVSHPNVCRVYDIGEVGEDRFLSMEYIDGEDLTSLLRRIGRLPQDKGIEIARQLCAGLAAVHDRGALHRDLKPGNIMIDGRGSVRLADFGLAGVADPAAGQGELSGTPAYMAPEQFEGRPASVHSDLYALGLVLYEIFTGKPAFTATTLREFARAHRETSPSSMSMLIGDLDPAVERTVQRCLEKDPADRPASAYVVAASLPGGDPLAAALARGETPAPELVAAAGDAGRIGPIVALAALAGVAVALLIIVFLSASVQPMRLAPLPKPPAVLIDRAQQVVRSFGYVEPWSDMSAGFGYSDYVDYLAREGRPRSDLRSEQPGAIVYWYRQSPRTLATFDFGSGARVTPGDPPENVSGMVGLLLDSAGRLHRFLAVPPRRDPNRPATAPDWRIAFREAGLDLSRFTAAPPRLTPPVYADTRAAWDGVYPLRPDMPIHVEAAGAFGRLVFFEVFEPWTEQRAATGGSRGLGQRVLDILVPTMFLSLMAGAALLATRNLRLGRGDRRGALRVALFLFGVELAAGLLGADHDPAIGPFFNVTVLGMGRALLLTAFLWLGYLALEPSVRRRWPRTLISWTRLLAGRWRNPLVGRDVLAGIVIGVLVQLLAQLAQATTMGVGDLAPVWPLDGFRFAMTSLLRQASTSLLFGMGILLFLFLAALPLRKPWIAASALLLVFAVITGLSSASVVGGVAYAVLAVGLLLVGLLRFGLLALVVAIFSANALDFFPLTFDLSAWYAWMSGAVLGIVFGLALFGASVSADMKSVFHGMLED
jgi:serine/threonine-protein kinase